MFGGVQDEEGRTNRRSFLGQMGRTIAVAFGAAVIPAVTASAHTAQRSPSRACTGISCVPVSCTKPCGSCNGSARLYNCNGCGCNYYVCSTHSPCGTFCISPC